jgi:OOP family OmpA-OmpF porin
MKKQIRFWFLGFVLLSIFVWSTAQAETVSPGNPGQLVGQLEADLAAARSNQVNVLAPGLYKEAESAFIKAKQGLEKGAKLSSINEFVAEGHVNLKKAEEIAKVSRTILGETNSARDKALKVGADRLGEPYMDVENQYLKLTKAIENDNLSYAQKRAAEVQAGFRNVEIMAIKNSAIGKVRNMMTEAENAKVQKIAPTAYNDALQAVNEVDAYIEKNPYAAETISQKTAHAEFMARRMMTISESSRKFQDMLPEETAIYVESLLVRLGKTMNTGDLRNKGVETQLSSLTGAVDTMGQKTLALEKDKQNYQAQTARLEQQLSSLKGYSREQEIAKQKLSAEREFNEQFNKVQRYFRPDEADVYKQGNQLVIRMRGIKFPVGQATLTPENYVLLSKVQQAIETFGQPSVIIEGHTDTIEVHSDSSGAAQTNQALSQMRAEVVKTYLVANNTLPASRIRATGFGPDRPLAPNSTPEGRAINRRIDLLITPANAR